MTRDAVIIACATEQQSHQDKREKLAKLTEKEKKRERMQKEGGGTERGGEVQWKARGKVRRGRGLQRQR